MSDVDQEQAKQLLREEADVFCSELDDIRDVTKCRMKIRLKGDTPIQKA